MKRTFEEIEKEVLKLIELGQKKSDKPFSEKAIGKTLKISPRFLRKIIDKLIKEGKIIFQS